MSRRIVYDFHEHLENVTRSLPIRALTLYDLDANIVYSTVLDRIGDSGRRSRGVGKALSGELASGLERRLGFNTLGSHGSQRDVDVFHSHLPVRGPGGEVIGALEIASDASALLADRELVESTVLNGIAAIAVVFYIALILIYRQSDVVIAKEQDQRDRALMEARAANEQLEVVKAE